MDKLIDRALEKDSSEIPQLPPEPDAALLSLLKSGSAVTSAGASAVKIARMGFFSGGAAKITLALFGLASVGTASYVLFSPSDKTLTPKKQETVIVQTDSTKKNHADTIVNGVRQPKAAWAEPAMPNAKPVDTTAAVPTEHHADDLLPAASHRINSNDSVRVPFKK